MSCLTTKHIAQGYRTVMQEFQCSWTSVTDMTQYLVVQHHLVHLYD
jgi:hypothetical protein